MSDPIPPHASDLPDPNDPEVRAAFDRDMEAMSWNQLAELGNRAIQMQLIIGHGFYKGQYEILHQGEALLMSPDEAVSYLQTLIRNATDEHG